MYKSRKRKKNDTLEVLYKHNTNSFSITWMRTLACVWASEMVWNQFMNAPLLWFEWSFQWNHKLPRTLQVCSKYHFDTLDRQTRENKTPSRQAQDNVMIWGWAVGWGIEESGTHLYRSVLSFLQIQHMHNEFQWLYYGPGWTDELSLCKSICLMWQNTSSGNAVSHLST